MIMETEAEAVAEADVDVESEHITTTNRLFLSHINYKNYTSNDEMFSSSNNNSDANSQYLSQEEVKKGLKELFSNYGTVQDIYLSDGKKLENNSSTSPTHPLPPSPFGFLAMETTEEAQLAINNLTSRNENDQDYTRKLRKLFGDIKPARTYKSKNNSYNKKERKQTILLKEYRERISYVDFSSTIEQDIQNTANIICQVSTSHLERFQNYVLNENIPNKNSSGFVTVKLISVVPIQKCTSLLLLRVDHRVYTTVRDIMQKLESAQRPELASEFTKELVLLLLKVNHSCVDHMSSNEKEEFCISMVRDTMKKIGSQRPELVSKFIQELKKLSIIFAKKIADGGDNNKDDDNNTFGGGGGEENIVNTTTTAMRTVESSVAETLLLKNEDSNDDSRSSIDYPEQFSQQLWDTWFIAPTLNRITILNNMKSDFGNKGIIKGNVRKDVVRAVFDSLIRLQLQLQKQVYFKREKEKEKKREERREREREGEREGGREILDKIKVKKQQEQYPFRVRVVVFPPKLQNILLKGLDEYMYMYGDDEYDLWDRCNSTVNNTILFTPTNPTHTISIIQLHPGVTGVHNSNGDNNISIDNEALYVLGRLETNQYINSNHAKKIPKNRAVNNSNSSTTSSFGDNKHNNKEESNSISRAYWKLQETWERYKFIPPCLDYKVVRDSNTDSSNKRQLWALDCGAAPGGWTKFLFRPGVVERIYSIDPGKLSKEVLPGLDDQNGGTNIIRYMDTTIQKAMAILVTEFNDYNNVSNERGDKKYLDIWVSDMNVKDMSNQIDYFLLARKEGLIGKGTFFVLTIKCVVGYSTIAFDSQTQEQVQRLTHTVEDCVRDVHVIHLFSNRTSERTIIGYLI